MDDFEKRLRAHDWASEPRSRWHASEHAPGALMKAWRGEPGSGDALMDSLAHDHSGSWYPVLLPAMPFIGEIIRRAPPDGVLAALEFLAVLVWSFDVDPETSRDPDGDERAWRDALWALYPDIRRASGFGRLVDDLAEGIESRLAGDRGLASAE